MLFNYDFFAQNFFSRRNFYQINAFWKIFKMELLFEAANGVFDLPGKDFGAFAVEYHDLKR